MGKMMIVNFTSTGQRKYLAVPCISSKILAEVEKNYYIYKLDPLPIFFQGWALLQFKEFNYIYIYLYCL